jgi:hypothetical protein
MPLHWDAGVELGAMQRVMTAAAPGAPSASPGPFAELHAHVALVPLVRLGPYVSYDVAPLSGQPAHRIGEAGLRAKITPPLRLDPWRAWIFAGAGYAHVWTGGVEGQFLDIPFGAGVGLRLRAPWELSLELGGRVGTAFGGTAYESPLCLCDAPAPGHETFALSLALGVSFGP